jgi:hypothetical protein
MRAWQACLCVLCCAVLGARAGLRYPWPVRTIAIALVLIGCGSEDVIPGSEAGPDAPPLDAAPDVAADASCSPPKTCTVAADCDDCNPCTVDTCESGGCVATQMPPPCCGDTLCTTPDETCRTCPGDCGGCGCCVDSTAGATLPGTTGCANATTETCVCTSTAADAAYCCDTGWDQTCVEDVTTLGCGTCACDTVHADGGCVDQAVSDCVCAADPVCCSEGWDATCVGEVSSLPCP